VVGTGPGSPVRVAISAFTSGLSETYSLSMKVRYVYWQEDDHWLGYLEDFPDYWTQGQSLEDLKEHLRDLHDDLSNDRIPEVRRTAELEVN
jgi:hypothetical protein